KCACLERDAATSTHVSITTLSLSALLMVSDIRGAYAFRPECPVCCRLLWLRQEANHFCCRMHWTNRPALLLSILGARNSQEASMVFLPGIVLSLFAGVEDKHLSNPVYRELRQQGLAVADKIAVPLPAPLMADGLDAAAQKAVLDKLVPDNLESFLRKSPVAPQIIRLGDIRPSDPKAPAHGVDFYFVAYGAFKTLTDKEFL